MTAPKRPILACRAITRLALICLAVAQPAGADWRTPAEDEIRAFLSGYTVSGNQDGMAWKQEFFPSGATNYYQGDMRDASFGLWTVRGNLYCSKWPPVEHWSCYRLLVDGERLVFEPEGGGAPWEAVRQPVQPAPD